MGKVYEQMDAERQANEIGMRFADSNNVMEDMSRAYHTSFSSIRIHTDAAADSKVKAAGKDALASGKDLYFGEGVYESDAPENHALVAHELAHTMQQGAAEGTGEMEAVPMGAEQGGLLNWFRAKFGRKRKAAEPGTLPESTRQAGYQALLQNPDTGEMGITGARAGETRGTARSSWQGLMTSEGLAAQIESYRNGPEGETPEERNRRILDSVDNRAVAGPGMQAARKWYYNKMLDASMPGMDDRMKQYFVGMNESRADFVTAAQNRQEFEAASPFEIRPNRETSSYGYNDAAFAMAGDFFRMAGEFLLTDAGLAFYLERQSMIRGDYLDINETSTEMFNNFMGIFTALIGDRFASAAAAVAADESAANEYNIPQMSAMRVIARNAGYLLEIPPKMDYMSDEEKSALPPQMTSLYYAYKNLQKIMGNVLTKKRDAITAFINDRGY